MHHATLNRAGPHDSDFDHQIVIIVGLQAGQHAHLRARFDLEYADGICALDHAIRFGVVIGNVFHLDRFAVPVTHDSQRFT